MNVPNQSQNKDYSSQIKLCPLSEFESKLPQPNQQHKTKQNKATFRQPLKLIFGMQPYHNPTRRNMEKDLNMEDDLIFFLNATKNN
jgi:hypothetical protein